MKFKNIYRIGAVIAWMLLIFALSAQPKLPYVPGLDSVDWSDKIKHFVAYGVLSALIWRALESKCASRRRFLLAIAISVLYGVTDEFHQRFVPNRSCDICDLATDAFGALVAAIIAWKVGEKHDRQKRRRESIRSKRQEASKSGRQP